MNAKLKQQIVKGALSLTIAAMIGYTIKLEKKICERIDDSYTS